MRRGAGWLCGILRTRVAPETGSGRRHEAVGVQRRPAYALDHHLEQLTLDNALAASIGKRLEDIPGIERVLPVDSNIVIFDVTEIRPGRGNC